MQKEAISWDLIFEIDDGNFKIKTHLPPWILSFITQMAQFSTVTGIEEMNSSWKAVEEFDQWSTASNLLKSVVPGDIGRADENGGAQVLDL